MQPRIANDLGFRTSITNPKKCSVNNIIKSIDLEGISFTKIVGSRKLQMHQKVVITTASNACYWPLQYQ